MMKLRPLSVSLAALLLVACGSDKSPPPAAPTNITSTITGTASKGIISKGIVTAYEINASGTAVRTLATAVTDANGRFSLAVPSDFTGGVVKVRITADAETRMKCDALDSCNGTAFGRELALDDQFALDAVLYPATKTVEVAVTPLTHMAVARAAALGGFTRENVAAANSELAALTGFDILSTRVEDVTRQDLSSASGLGVKYGLFNAAVAALLYDGTSNTNDVNANLGKLAKTFADGRFDATDDYRIASLLQSLTDVRNYFQDTYPRSPALINAISSLELQAEHIRQRVDAGELDPAITGNFRAGRIGQAKAFIELTKPLYPHVIALDPARNLALKPFRDQQATVQHILDDETLFTTQLLGEVLNQALLSVNNGIHIGAAIKAGEIEKILEVPLTGLKYTVQKTITVTEGTEQVSKTVDEDVVDSLSVRITYPAGGQGLTLYLSGYPKQQNGEIALTLNTNVTSTEKAGLIDILTQTGTTLALDGFTRIGGTGLKLTQVAMSLAASESKAAVATLVVSGDSEIIKADALYTGTTKIGLKANSSTLADMRLSELQANGLFSRTGHSVTTEVIWKNDALLDLDTYNTLARYKLFSGQFADADIDTTIFDAYIKANAAEKVVARRSYSIIDANRKPTHVSEVYNQVKLATRDFTETTHVNPNISFTGLPLVRTAEVGSANPKTLTVNFDMLQGTENFDFRITRVGNRYTYFAPITGITGLADGELTNEHWSGTLSKDIDGNGSPDSITLTMQDATTGRLEIIGTGSNVNPVSLTKEQQYSEVAFKRGFDASGNKVLNYTVTYALQNSDLSRCLDSPTTFSYTGYYRFVVTDATTATKQTCYDMLTTKATLTSTASQLKPASEAALVAALITDGSSYERIRTQYEYDTRYGIKNFSSVVSFAENKTAAINEQHILSNKALEVMPTGIFTLLTRQDATAGPLFEVLGSRDNAQFKLQENRLNTDKGPVHQLIVSNASNVKLVFELIAAGAGTIYGGDILVDDVNVGRIGLNSSGKLEFLFRDETRVTL